MTNFFELLYNSFMKQFKIFFVVLFFATNVFANSWYVCLASFKNETNAETFSQFLRKNKIENFIFAFKNQNGKTFHRVLFDKAFSSRTSARNLRDTLLHDKKIRELNLNDLWICEAEKPAQKNKKIVLKKSASIPTTSEKPFSILVQKNKNEEDAKKTNERLHEKSVDSYIVKKYNDDELFSFDVHAGAFATEAETKTAQEELSKKGICDTEIANYEDFKDEVKNYNDVVQREVVQYESGNEKIPDSIPKNVVHILNEFPVNKNFQVEEIFIWDFDAIGSEKKTDFENDMFTQFLSTENGVSAASLVHYKDSLYGNDIVIVIAEIDDRDFENKINDFENDETEIIHEQFALRKNILNAKIKQDGNAITLIGLNEKKNLFVGMIANNFSLDDFKLFIKSGYKDSSLLVFPEIRKTLFILPHVSQEHNRNFLFFHASKVGDDYVALKGYADWAQKIKGHWDASGYYRDENKIISTSFFDLEYDFAAKEAHQLFTNAHALYETASNHRDYINGEEAWYVETFDGKELSFYKNVYIVAVDMELDGNIDLLKSFANDLLIWK